MSEAGRRGGGLTTLVYTILFYINLLYALGFFRLKLLTPVKVSFCALALLKCLFSICCRVKPMRHGCKGLLLFNYCFPAVVSNPVVGCDSVRGRVCAKRGLSCQGIAFNVRQVLLKFFGGLIVSRQATVLTGRVFGGCRGCDNISV